MTLAEFILSRRIASECGCETDGKISKAPTGEVATVNVRMTTGFAEALSFLIGDLLEGQ